MKKVTNSTALLITVLLSMNSMFGQEIDLQREANSALIVKIDQASSLSKAAGELRRKLETGDKKAAFDAINSCDATLLPILELYADNGIQRMRFSEFILRTEPWFVEYYKQINGDADAALAKSGRTEYMTRILHQTDKSKKIKIRYEAVRKLFLVGNKLAYIKIQELLDETAIPPPPSNSSDFVEINSPMSDVVMNALAETVSDPPNLKNVYETDKKILLWKKWFEKHKELTEGAEMPKCGVVNTPKLKPIISKTDNSYVNGILFTDYLSIVLLGKLF
jgi:hypothetical protein